MVVVCGFAAGFASRRSQSKIVEVVLPAPTSDEQSAKISSTSSRGHIASDEIVDDERRDPGDVTRITAIDVLQSTPTKSFLPHFSYSGTVISFVISSRPFF